MTALDRYGYTYITKDGDAYCGKNSEPENWVLSFHFAENDGWAFRRNGPERCIVIDINSSSNFDEARSLSDYLKNNGLSVVKDKKLNYAGKKTLDIIIAELNKMIKARKRSRVIEKN